MAPHHSKHAILEGVVDSFCLVCETYLKCEEEKETHILQESHIQHLNATLYVEEFKNDGIRKITNKYFCELCNRLLPVLARVRLHVNDTRHIHKKMISSIKRVDNYVVAFEEIAISEQSWQGFCENFCAVCNIEYDAEMKHKIEPTHILNLIQMKITFDKEKNIYRKIDEESCQCLTCNMVIALNMITFHFSGLEHKNKLQACQDDIQVISKLLEQKKANGQKEVVTCKDVSETIEIFDLDSTMLTKNDPSEPIDMDEKSNEAVTNATEMGKLLEHQKVNEQKEVETCKDVSETIEMFNSDSTMLTKNEPSELIGVQEKSNETSATGIKDEDLEKCVKENKNEVSTCLNNKVKNNCSEYIYDEKSEEKIIQILNCTEYITRDENGKTWCILCGWVMDAATIYMHINGEHHNNILNMHKKRLGNLIKSNNISTMTNKNVTNTENKNRNPKTNDLKDRKEQKKSNKPHEYKTEKVISDEEGKDSIVNINIERSNEMSKNTQCKMTKDTTNIIELVPKFEKSGININLELNSAVCRKCTVSIDFNVDAIENHIVEHNKKPIKKEINSVSFSAGEDKVLNRKNSLFTSPVHLKQTDSEKDKRSDNRIEESLHDTRITKNEEENAQSMEVQIVKPQIKNSTLQKIPCGEFINEMFAVTDNIFKDIIINDNLCINFFSLVFLLPSEGMVRCLYCKTTVEDFNTHISSFNHLTAMEQSPVITNFDSEFIREIHLGQYHCGYCNVVVSSWDIMEKHLESSSHEESKKSACWRLQGYGPLIFRNNLERHLQERFLVDFIRRFF